MTGPLSWLVWGAFLLLQNAAFVANSRARNGSSLKMHAITNLFSNGVWMLSQLFVIDKLTQVLRSHDWLLLGEAFTFYVILNMVGGLSAHHWMLKRNL